MVKTDPDKDQKKKVHLIHDTTYRHFLAVKKLFVELLQSFVDEKWVQEVHETNLEQFPNDFVPRDFSQKKADLVYQVRLNDDNMVFCVLTEMQSTVDFQILFRLLEYKVEIWRHWLKNEMNKKEDATRRKSYRLPVIVPIVLYNGKQTWTASRKFREILDCEHLFGSWLIDFEYFLVDVKNYSEEQLLTLANTISSVFLLDQTETLEQAQDRLNRLRSIIQQLPEESRNLLHIWIENGLKMPKDSLKGIIQNEEKGAPGMGLREIADSLERKGRLEGRVEGERKGRLEGILKGRMEGEREGKEKVARKLINMGLDTSSIIEATGFEADEVEKLRKSSS
jgi:predicted transposase/invertase (TIGR01784 family)